MRSELGGMWPGKPLVRTVSNFGFMRAKASRDVGVEVVPRII